MRACIRWKVTAITCSNVVKYVKVVRYVFVAKICIGSGVGLIGAVFVVVFRTGTFSSTTSVDVATFVRTTVLPFSKNVL